MNYHTPWADGVTAWRATSMNPPLADIDRALTYHKLAIVGCDGTVSWATGTLTWSDKLHIYFNRTDGQVIHNEIAAGNIALSDAEVAYVTLSETNDATITVSKHTMGTGSASTFLPYNVLVLGYRNTADDKFYAAGLASCIAPAPDLSTALDGREQEITCANSVTVNFASGASAFMVLDRASTDITLAGGVDGHVYRLRITQDNAGNRAITWTTTVIWRGGPEPTWTVTGDKSDWITLVCSDGDWYGDGALAF